VASFDDFCGGLLAAGVRFVVIGVSGANFYAGSNLFMTGDQDLVLPRDSAFPRARLQVPAARLRFLDAIAALAIAAPGGA